MEQTFSCNQDIIGDREGVGEPSCKWREHVSGVGRGNGDKKNWHYVVHVPMRYHRNNEVGNDTHCHATWTLPQEIRNQ